MPNFENQILEMRSYVKSNEMIGAKHNSSLLENQVMAIAITRIEEKYEEGQISLEANLYPGELRRLVSDKSHIYRDLKALAKSIIGRTMFIEDGKGNFKAFSLVPNAEYTDGVFTIKFNQELSKHFFGLRDRGNFTTLEIGVMTNFDRNSSFRIYELLKKDIFRSNYHVNQGRVDVEYDLFEFRFLIGAANIDSDCVKNKIKTMSIIDWEVLYSTLEKEGTKNDIRYKDSDKLKKDVINPAQVELAEKSDIRFEYELVRIGRSYKRIRFHIYPNTPSNESSIQERQRFLEDMKKPNRQLELPMDLSSEYSDLYDKYIGHNDLTKEDLDLLVRTANMDVATVTASIEYVDGMGFVKDYMGYIISCIQNRYFEKTPTEVMAGSKNLAAFARHVQSDEGKQTTWEYFKTKKDFSDFLEFEQRERGLSFEVLDTAFPVDEAVAEYIDWMKNYKIKK